MFDLIDFFFKGFGTNVFGNLYLTGFFILMVVLILLKSFGTPNDITLLIMLPIILVCSLWINWIFTLGLLIVGFLFAVALTTLFQQQY